MNFSQAVPTFVSIGLLVLSIDSFAQDAAAKQGEVILGPDRATRVIQVAPTVEKIAMFKNGQLLRQPRNALTTSGCAVEGTKEISVDW